MLTSAPETPTATPPPPPVAPREEQGDVLRLLVRNHPGVMSHVCGLFARRAFNLESIVCLPVGDASRSVILLIAGADDRVEQVVRQLRKLEDVLEVRHAPEARPAFAAVGQWLR